MTFDEQLVSCLARHEIYLLRYIQNTISCSLEQAEDILQESLESIIRYKSSFKGGEFILHVIGVVKKFIWKTAHPNDVSVKKRIETSREQYRALDINTEEWLYGVNNNTPDKILLYKEQQNILIGFINTLKYKQKETALHYVYNVPTKLTWRQLNSNWYALLKSMESIKWNAINLTWSW